MIAKVEFKSSRLANFGLGVGLLAIAGCVTYLVGFGSEEQLLGSHARRSGFIKMIEQAIGWEAFCFLMVCFGTWLFIYAVVHIWKAIDGTPDVTAFPDKLEFHPAVRRLPLNYEDVTHWSIKIESGNPVVWIHLRDAYWSLQGLFKRKTVKLEGDQTQLAPLVDYFSTHEIMGRKYVKED